MREVFLSQLGFINKLKHIYFIYSRVNSLELIADIVRDVFIDIPNEHQGTYNFEKNPPELHGQIGVPPIVDKILGIKSVKQNEIQTLGRSMCVRL